MKVFFKNNLNIKLTDGSPIVMITYAHQFFLIILIKDIRMYLVIYCW